MRAERAAHGRDNTNGSALVAAILALALGGAVATALSEVARLSVVRGRLQEQGIRAWFLAEAGLAEAVAAIPPGRSFDAALAVPARSGGAAPWTWTGTFSDDTDDMPNDRATDTNERVILAVEASGPAPVRRRLSAVVGREPEPFLPGTATLGGGVRELARDFLLDGRDFDMDSRCTRAGDGPPRAGLALINEAPLSLIDPAQVVGGTRRTGLVPDLTTLAHDPTATPHAAGALTGPLGHHDAPRFTVVHGDAVAASPISGAGLLYVDGRLSIRRALDFTGVLAAAEGIEVTAEGSLTVCGAIWAGGDPALAVRGRGALRRSAEAIRTAHRLSPLPARAKVHATRELFGGIDG